MKKRPQPLATTSRRARPLRRALGAALTTRVCTSAVVNAIVGSEQLIGGATELRWPITRVSDEGMKL